jgi:hypothetical protein
MLKGGLKKIAMVVLMVAMALWSVNPGFAGAYEGPKIGSYVIDERCIDKFEIKFYGGEEARVAVRGDGDTDLDLYVRDIYGNLIACDEGPTDTCFVSWVPKWTGTFVIRVVNRGYIPNEYAIATN